MRVNFTHKEVTKGILRKTTHPVVTVQVVFSEEERVLIKQERYEDDVVLDYVPYNARPDRDERIYYMRVKDLLRGPFEFMAENNVEAKAFETATIERLQTLKELLEAGSTAGTSKTVEI